VALELRLRVELLGGRRSGDLRLGRRSGASAKADENDARNENAQSLGQMALLSVGRGRILARLEPVDRAATGNATPFYEPRAKTAVCRPEPPSPRTAALLLPTAHPFIGSAEGGLMRVLHVYCHPLPESFHAALREAALAGLKAAGHEVDLLDLYAEKFDPVLSEDGRRRFHDVPQNRGGSNPVSPA